MITTTFEPLKILLLTEASSAGVGRHVADLATELLKRGCAVHVVYSNARIDARFAASMNQPGLQTYVVDMKRIPHPSDYRVVRALKQYVRKHGGFDVIHAHSSKAGVVSRIAKLDGQTPLVYTPHCIYTMNPAAGKLAHALIRTIECFLAARSTAIIAVSPEEQAHLHQLGIDPGIVHFIANGVDGFPPHRKCELRAALDFTEEQLVIGFLGRLAPQKNPELLIRAFATIAKRNPRVVLAIAGTGSRREVCQALCERAGVAGQVRWLGQQDPAEFLGAIDIFALPSRYEGMPYVLLEALAAKLPVVATNVGGVTQTIVDGVNGYVVADATPRRFAAALEKLVDDPATRQAFAMASAALAEKFSLQAMVDRTLKMYGQLAGRCQPPPPIPETNLISV